MSAPVDKETMNATRREFVRQSALGLTVAGCAGPGAFQLRADPLGFPIGCQTFPVRNALSQDFDGTLRQLAGMGYQTIEMCSPPGYASAGYGVFANMKAAEMRHRIQDAGLHCESCHYQFSELKAHMDERIAFAKELGLKQMVVATFALRPDATLSDWARAADELNHLGEQTQKAGIQLGFHNHDFEFHEIDGVLIYDKLMETFEPKLIRLQFQVAVIRMGYKASTYLRKYPEEGGAGAFRGVHHGVDFDAVAGGKDDRLGGGGVAAQFFQGWRDRRVGKSEPLPHLDGRGAMA